MDPLKGGECPRRILAPRPADDQAGPRNALDLDPDLEFDVDDDGEDTGLWPAWAFLPVEFLFSPPSGPAGPDGDDAGPHDGRADAPQPAEEWPPWTDAPVEFLDYDAFDDDGMVINHSSLGGDADGTSQER